MDIWDSLRLVRRHWRLTLPILIIGLLLSLRGRNYNFLGTLEPLRVNLNYLRTPEQEHEWSVVTTFALPFQWVGKYQKRNLWKHYLLFPN